LVSSQNMSANNNNHNNNNNRDEYTQNKNEIVPQNKFTTKKSHKYRTTNRKNRSKRSSLQRKHLIKATNGLQLLPTPDMMTKIKDILKRKRMKQKTLASLLRVR
jgi:hypothetical protein